VNRFFAFLFFAVSLTATDWEYTYTFRLKKDETARIEVHKNLQNPSSLSGVMEFRWTLYKNEGLVLLVKYEGFPRQYVLYRKNDRDFIKISLSKKPPKEWLESYLLMKFEDFDEKSYTAVLGVFIKSPLKEFEVSFIEPKRKQRVR